jgi:hypothetical protein
MANGQWLMANGQWLMGCVTGFRITGKKILQLAISN